MKSFDDFLSEDHQEDAQQDRLLRDLEYHNVRMKPSYHPDTGHSLTHKMLALDPESYVSNIHRTLLKHGFTKESNKEHSVTYTKTHRNNLITRATVTASLGSKHRNGSFEMKTEAA